MTVTVKAMDSQRWICRTHWFQFKGTSSEDEPNADRAHPQASWTTAPGWWKPRRPRASTRSWDPREHVDELPAHQLPAVARTGEVLLLIRLEAGVHERQARTRRRRRQREGHDGVHAADHPLVAEPPLRLDLE